MKNKDSLSNMDIIFYEISKNEIILKDTYNVNKIINELRNAGIKSQKKLFIVIDGYNEDIREIYEIKVIRDYMSKLFEENIDLFFYLSDIQEINRIILACIGEYKVINRNNKVLTEIQVDIETKKKIVDGLLNMLDFNEEKTIDFVNKLIYGK